MTWWAWCAVGLVAAWCWRVTFRQTLIEIEEGSPGERLGRGAVLFALTYATIGFVYMGPFLILRAVFLWVTRGVDWDVFAWRLAGESREMRRARRLRELAERERRMAEMERDLGIGQ